MEARFIVGWFEEIHHSRMWMLRLLPISEDQEADRAQETGKAQITPPLVTHNLLGHLPLAPQLPPNAP